MKVLVLGGAGIVGKAITKELSAQSDVSQVVIGDMNAEGAEKYMARLGGDKVSFEKINVSDHDRLVKSMQGFDVVANCVYYETILEVTKAAIEAGVHIVDLGGFYYGTQKQMKLHEEAASAGVTLLHGCGSGPGLTNIVSRYAADRLDKVDEIHIRAGGVAPSPGSPPIKGAGMTIRTVLDEFTINPMAFENGEHVQKPCISGREVVVFPDPIGAHPTYYSLHSEQYTLSKYIEGVNTVTLKVVFPEDELAKLKPLIDLGLTSNEPIDYNGQSIAPRQFLDRILVGQEQQEEEQGSEFCASVIYVTGERGGQAVKLTYTFMVEHEKRWGNTKTGVPLAVGTLMLGRGEITKRGFTVPEECIDPGKFILECKDRGFVFTEKEEIIRKL